MKYEDVIIDIQKLVGRQLNSIKKGAEITITAVNLEDGRIELMTSKGQAKSRPFSEIRTIWRELSMHPAIHVEQVLKGSGSSRNQPETIFANLPYIEWLRIDGKKHIAYVGKSTHDLGTLKQMDSIQADSLRRQLQSKLRNIEGLKAIIIAGDIAPAAQSLEHMTGLPVQALEPGVYVGGHQKEPVLLVAKDSVPENIRSGTYMMIPSHSIIKDGKIVTLADGRFTLVSLEGACFAARLPE